MFDSKEIDSLVQRTVIGGSHERRMYLGPFQSIDQPTAVELAPLTFLIGPNSSGKSTILDALKILAAGLRHDEGRSFGRARGEWKLHESSRRLRSDGKFHLLIGYGCTRDWRDVDPQIEFNEPAVAGATLYSALFQESPPGTTHSLDVVFSFSGAYRHSDPEWMGQYLDGLPFITLFEQEALLHVRHPWFASPQGRSFLGELEDFLLPSKREDGARKLVQLFDMEIFPLNRLEQGLRLFSDDPTQYHMQRSILQAISMLLGWDARGTTSLGPWRQVPEEADLEHTFQMMGNSPTLGGGTSWNGGLAAWKRIAYAFADSEDHQEQELISHLNGWLESPEKFDCGLTVQAELLDVVSRARGKSRAKKKEPVRAVNASLYLQDGEGRELQPNEVGSGISQIVPIIVALKALRGPIHVEQPELHLHPRAQAALGDLFLSFADEDSRTAIVETHSELLLLRILRRLRERHPRIESNPFPDLPASQIVAYYFDPDRRANSTTIYKIRISADGRFLDPWPKGFFAESDDELLRLFEADDKLQ